MLELIHSLPAAHWVTAALLAALLLLALVAWSMRTHREPKLTLECDAGIADTLPSLAGLTQSVPYAGNQVVLYEGAAFFEQMFEDIAAAQYTLHFETFLWKHGLLSTRLTAALCARSRAGVRVRVMVDANGGKEMGAAVQRELKDAGCKLTLHHPRRLRDIGVLNDRDHRKLLVVDGRTAMVGGHCITDSWLGDGAQRTDARDIGVRLLGPAVHGVQAVFAENWVEDTGELIVGDNVFPAQQPAGSTTVHVASLKPEGSPPAVKLLHHLVVCSARTRLWIQNPYFLPDLNAIQALAAAVERGVDVRVMVPSINASDMPMVQHAAHRNFGRLLQAGVRIYEYQPCLIHQKVMTVDGAWCAVGSSNFDDRSFETNDEITLGIHDAGLAARLEAIFQRDTADCTELTLEGWRRRGLWHRMKDHAAYAFNELL